MTYDYKGWWIDDAKQYLSNYRIGAICVTYSKEAAEKMYKDLPRLITDSDIDQYAYGIFLLNNHKSTDDLKKALQIAKRLMANKNVLGNNLYAKLIFDGTVLQKIDNIAVQHWERVLYDIPDFAPAIYSLAHCYYYGKGVNKDISLSMKYIEKAKDLGYNPAINYIGLCYYNGNNNYPIDYKKSFDCFKESSFRGDENGYYYLATLYFLGKGCTKDYKRALECFSLAGAKGHIEAAMKAGSMHFSGTHVPKNDDAAAYCYKIAANAGNVEAMYIVAVIYINTYYNQEEGIEWLKKACKLGHNDAIKLANKMNIRY